MAHYYDIEAAASGMEPEQGSWFIKRWIQALGKMTGPVRKAATQQAFESIVALYDKMPWAWTDNLRESQLRLGGYDTQELLERREELGHRHVTAGYEGCDIKVDYGAGFA
jgi:hypothetical protein